MVTSMTGYGRAQQLIDGREISVEIKSVNHRYFEFSVRAPRSLGYLEEKLKSLVHAKTARGKVDVNVSVVSVEAATAQVEINLPLAQSYLTALREMGETLGLDDDLRLSTLSRFHDIYTVRKVDADEEALWLNIETVANEALQIFLQMKRSEGEKLAADISQRLDVIAGYADNVDARNPQIVDAYRERLTQKLTDLLADRNIDDARILTETAIFAEKTATAEETVRLRSHISQMRGFLSGGEATGRKMDFLVQEMNREANTIGSKAQDTGTQHLVVDLKSEIEKMREQIQNIE